METPRSIPETQPLEVSIEDLPLWDYIVENMALNLMSDRRLLLLAKNDPDRFLQLVCDNLSTFGIEPLPTD